MFDNHKDKKCITEEIENTVSTEKERESMLYTVCRM